MNDLTALLTKSRLLECLPADVIEQQLIPNGSVLHYSPNATVISLQEKVDHISVLLTGRIQMMHLYASGTYSLITTLTPPESLGLELIGTQSRISPYLAVAAAETSVFSFPADLILRAGTLPPDLQLAALNRLLNMVSNFNMQKEYRLAILSQNGLRDRILTYLTMQAAKRGSDTFQIPFSREEMASFLCVNRSALSHELSLMRKEGLIDFSKNTFTLLRQE